MPITPIKTPEVIKAFFPNYIWNIDTTENVMYLTFDDGPTPEVTDWVLHLLAQYNAKATFFCIGDNVQKYPEIFQRVIVAGHSIGNHTQNHLKGWKTKTKMYLDDVLKAQDTISKQYQNTQYEIQYLFRPPYGKIKPKQGKSILEKGYQIVMWDVLSFDWDKNVSQINCLNNVISKATKGSIVVFHDSAKASNNMKYALPKVLEHFSEKGYTFKALQP